MFVAFLATSSVLPAAVLVDWNFASLPANLASQENVVASNPLLPSSEATVATGLTVTSINNVGSLQYSSANGPTTGTALARVSSTSRTGTWPPSARTTTTSPSP